MKGKQPITSLEAYHSLDPESIEVQHQKIIKAIGELKTATADEVCKYLGMDVWRRFSELVKGGKIVNTGAKRLTRKGRNAFVFQLPDEETTLLPTEKIPAGKGVSDFSKAIKNIGDGVPLTLF